MGMSLVDLMLRERVRLELGAQSKREVLGELVAALGLGESAAHAVLQAILEREEIGSTGIGQQIAVPHCRSDAVDRIQVVYGRKLSGIDFGALDGRLVRHFFLIVAPHEDAGGSYLETLASVAQLCKMTDVIARLESISEAGDFLALLVEKDPGSSRRPS